MSEHVIYIVFNIAKVGGPHYAHFLHSATGVLIDFHEGQ